MEFAKEGVVEIVNPRSGRNHRNHCFLDIETGRHGGRNGLPKWSRETCGVTIQTVNRSAGAKGFEVLPKRWVVERTIAWLNRYRRLAKDYERDPETDEAIVHIAMNSLMLKRLAKPQSHF